MPFIGKTPTVGNFVLLDAITVSNTATFALTKDTLDYYPGSAQNMIVSVNGVTQAPLTAYTIVDNNITFSSALDSDVDVIDYILVLGDTLNIGRPSDGTVGAAQLQDYAVTSSKMSNTGVSAATYGTSTSIPQITIDAAGRITSATGIDRSNSFEDLTVTGNLTVSGNTVTVDAQTLSVEDPLIHLAANNESSDVVDIGFVGHYSNDGGTTKLHTGFFRDASDEQYYLFNGFEDDNLDLSSPSTIIDRTANTFALADLNVGAFTSTGIDDSASSTAITINSSQDVAFTSGIDVTGTVTGQKLVASDGLLELDDNGTHNGIINVPASLFINIDSDNTNTGEDFVIAKDRTSTSGGTELFRVQEDGNVGIGTTSPVAHLNVNAGGSPDATYGIANFAGGSGVDSYVTISRGANDQGGIKVLRGSVVDLSIYVNPAESSIINYNGGDTNDGLFFRRGSAGTEVMTLDSSGNVGIGTTSPTFISGSGIEIQKADSATIRVERTGTTASAGEFFAGNDKVVLAATSNTPMQFRTDALERMRITSDGKIGIGNTAPVAMMQITGTGDLLRIESTNAGTSGAQLDLIHFSASPADGDTVGVINFSGYDTGNNPTQYASIKGEASSLASEHGELNFGVRTDGSTFHHNKLTINRTYSQFVNEMGDEYKASIMLTPDGGASDRYSGMALKATFGSYPADTTPRRAADIWAGFTSTWNTEFLAFGVGNAGSSNDAGNQTDEKMRILSTGVVKAAESYKFNLVTVVSYNNTAQNTVQTGMNNQVFLISIHHSAGVSAILCLPNGGSGVAYDFQMTDPDSGTISNTNEVSFTMAGTGGNTFTASILGGSGNVTVQRTAGSGSYTVYINQILGGLV